jgi:hypothetical protein
MLLEDNKYGTTFDLFDFFVIAGVSRPIDFT